MRIVQLLPPLPRVQYVPGKKTNSNKMKKDLLGLKIWKAEQLVSGRRKNKIQSHNHLQASHLPPQTPD